MRVQGFAFVESAKETFVLIPFVIPVPLFLLGGGWRSSKLRSVVTLCLHRAESTPYDCVSGSGRY